MRSAYIFLLFVLLSGIQFPPVAWTKISFGEKVVVDVGQTEKEAVSFGEDVHVYGTVKKAAVSFGGDVFVERGGSVDGDAVSIGGDIFVRNNAKIRKNAITIGGEIHKDYCGVVHGDNITIKPENLLFHGLASKSRMNFENTFGDVIANIFKVMVFGPIIGFFGVIGVIIAIIFSALKLALFLVFAVLITYFFPEQVSRMAEFTQKEFWRSLLLGFLVILLPPFIIIALILTIIGIPTIPLFLVLLFIMYMYGSVGIALLVGSLLPKSEQRTEIWNVVVGCLVIGLVKLIPGIGFLCKVVIVAVSFGVVLFTRFGTQKNTTA